MPGDEIRRAVTDRLARAGCVAAEDEAAWLLAAASDGPTLARWVARRERGEPLAWIVGRVEFLGTPLRVDPGVYVPRPQSEGLAQRAVEVLAPTGTAVDLCTGSGAVAAHLRARRPDATVVATDLDPGAARCARANGVPALVTDLDAAMADRTVDLVTAVAPYVPTDALRVLPADVTRHEPRRALDGGDDGLDVLRRLVHGAARVLRPGGWLLVEAGGEQDRGLAPALSGAGFATADPWRDEDGDLRGVAARLRAG